MIQKINLLLMMFTKYSLRVTLRIQGVVTRKSSPYDGSSQDSHFSQSQIQHVNETLYPQLHNSNQISPIDFKNINWNDPKGSPASHDVHQVFPEGYLSIYRT